MRVRLEGMGIAWYPLRYHKRPSLPATIYDTVVGAGLLGWLIKQRGIDVVHVRNHVPGLMAGYGLFGTKLLFDIRGFMAEEYVDAGVWREGGIPYRLVKAVERRLLRDADAIVMLTHKIHDVLLERDPVLRGSAAHVEIIPCCADLERHTAEGAGLRQRLGLADRRVMVYAGSTGGWYMLPEMAQLAKAAMVRDPRIHVLFLSHTPAAQIRDAFSAQGVAADRLTVLAVEPDEMPAHLAAADFAVSFIKPCFSKLSSSPTKIVASTSRRASRS